MNTIAFTSLLFAAGTAAAVSSGEKTAHEHESPSCCTPDESTAPRASYLERANPLPANAVKGTVTGKVVWGGDERPEIDELTIAEKQQKGCVEGGAVDTTNRSLLISKEGGIQHVVCSIEVKDAELKIPEDPILLDQIQCRFEPHVLLIPMGATVEYVNSDTISHNVHTYSTKNPAFNKTIAAGASEQQTLEKSESIEVKCDIHPWMSCYLFISETPYAATTGADGSFSIEGLPAGDYEIEVWHEKLGKGDAEVTVNEDGTSEAVEIEMEEKSKGGGRRRRR